MSDIDLLAHAVREAGDVGLRYFGKDPNVWTKGEGSPVSEADMAIDQYLKETLLSARPDYGWLSEESEDSDERLHKKRCFVVDPIDGTRGFIQQNENWMVCIAVVENGRPLSAVLYGPILKKLYHAEVGKGAFCNGDVIASSNHTRLTEGHYVIPARVANPIQSTLENQMKRADHIHSLAYRLALVADGGLAGAVVRPHAKDWDLAAADLILHEAGAHLCNVSGERPLYNKRDTSHSWLVAANGSLLPLLKNALIDAIESEG